LLYERCQRSERKFTITSKLSNILALAWLLLVSVLTVARIAPNNLNADIVLNSIMSQQNLTLFYWGQNRLLNVLPFAASLATNPSFNLATILIFSAMSFYGLIYGFSIVVLRLIGSRNTELSLSVSIFISSVGVFILTPEALAEVTIGHIEYSLPVVGLIFASLTLLNVQVENWKLRSVILPSAVIFLSVGINPSSAILALFIVFSVIFYRRKLQRGEIVFLAASVAAFLAWDAVSRLYSSVQYGKIDLDQLWPSIQQAFENLSGIFNRFHFLAFTALIFFLKFLSPILIRENAEPPRRRAAVFLYIAVVAIAFSIFWLIFLSSLYWVQINQLNWRYFTFVIFAFLFVLTFYVSDFFEKLKRTQFWVISGTASIATIVSLAISNPTFEFVKYELFQRVNTLVEPGGHLYSGNYWDVWPAVFRDMMSGHEAYGLAPRGEANKDAARKYVLKKIKELGRINVYCLNDTVDNCISSVNSIAGPLKVVDSVKVKEGVFAIAFSE